MGCMRVLLSKLVIFEGQSVFRRLGKRAGELVKLCEARLIMLCVYAQNQGATTMHVTSVPIPIAATECVSMGALPNPQADQQVSLACPIHDACTLLRYAST